MDKLEQTNYFAVIPANVRYDKGLSANAKLLFGEITALCNEKGFCWASNDYFARLYSVSKETISRWISQLVKKQYIRTKLFYKKESKEVDKRIISITQQTDDIPIDNIINTPIDENVNRYLQNNQGIDNDKNINTPIDENIKENNTYINNNIYSRVIDYLNEKTGKKYKCSTKKTKELINARLNEGFKEADFKKVISIKTTEWKNDKQMSKYLRPETLFGNKFEGYLNQEDTDNNTIYESDDFSEYKY